MSRRAIPLAVALWAAGSAAAAPPATWTNAALSRWGARVSVRPAPGGSRDPQTPPEAVLDGDPHTRCVLRGGTPYTFTIELPLRVMVDRVAFADSDYATERAPGQIEIATDDGPLVHHTLALKRPEKRRPVWQEVRIGRETRVIRVTVRSEHVPTPTVNWGGLAEIAVFTNVDLEQKLAVPGYDAAAPVFVHAPPATTGASARVRLPAPVPPGEHPRLLLSRAEIAELKNTLAKTDRGRAALAGLIRLADGIGAPVFPDPKGTPAQLTDRGDAVAKQHDRLSLNAGTLGVAYGLTAQEKYARGAAAILRGYAQRYAAYPEHRGANRSDTGKVMAQRLSEAMWLIPLISAYDHVYDSGALTPQDKRRIETELIRPAITFIRRNNPAAEAAERDRREPNWRTATPTAKGASNWLLHYNAATIMAGAAMNDRDLIDLAVADFRRLLVGGIGSDGLWNEGAIGYQFFALAALVPGMETAARQGIDLWGFDNSRVKRLFDSPLRYAYPDGSAPGINDSGRTRFGDWSTMVYDYAFLRYGDPAYAALVNASPRQLHMSEAVYFPTRIYEPLAAPAATAFPSTVFESLGYAILRGPRAYALLDTGPHGGVHGHFDKLNLILYAANDTGKGDEIGGEPRFHRYEDVLHDQWTVQTVAHNTLAVDETSQTASEGRLLVFEDTPDVKVMRAESASSAPGALLDRTVVVLPDAILDLYHGRSATPRVWDRTLRFGGTLQKLPAANPTATPLGTRDGYQHLRVAGRSAATAPWKGVWETPAGAWNVTVAGMPTQQVITARGPDDEGIALARQQGERADFAVGYGLDAWRNPIQSLRPLATGDPNTVGVEMTQGDGTATTVFVAHGAGAWTASGWRSDARVLCLRRKGSALTILLTGGTFATGREGAIRRDAPGNYRAERRGGGLEIVSEWAK